MNFTEFDFWPRLLAGFLIIWIGRAFVKRRPALLPTYDRIALAALSVYLLSHVGILTTVIFGSVFFTAWILVILMFRVAREHRHFVLAFGIPLLCAPLIYYKYRFFIIKDVFGSELHGNLSLAIPAGISFYTFQKIAMLVDAYRMKEWHPKFLDYLNFASFFPQVVAGPIERKANLFPQLERFSFEWSWARVNAGAPALALGLFYKLCIADNLSPYVDRNSIDSAWPILISTLVFGLKIYFDFCGYSLIALGLAKFLGVNLTLNFQSPYWSGSIREFWRRWHISLSYWFRDYIYIPLGGSQTKRWAFNLFVVFVISGIWHGAGWGFLIWGALHGGFSIVSHFMKDKIRLPWILGWLVTLFCVFLSWLPFYETRMDMLVRKIQVLADPHAYALGSLSRFIHHFDGGELLTMAAAILFALAAIGLEGVWKFLKKEDYSFSESPWAIAACIAAVILLGATKGNEFVYFAF